MIDRDVALLARKVTEFWSKVDASIADPTACWPWRGYVNKDGYGEFHFAGDMHGAHELALAFATGATKPEGFDTCHSCDNPMCCNPAHLRFDTRQSNVNDAVARSRHAYGARHGRSKLTEDDVLTIRVLFANGASGTDLAARYKVQPSAITQVVRGTRWRHVGGPITRLPAGRPYSRKARNV